MDTPARLPWYRSATPAFLLAVVALTALVVWLTVRLAVEPVPDVVASLCQAGLYGGIIALMLAQVAVSRTPERVPGGRLGRFVLRLFPGADQAQGVATPAVQALARVATGVAFAAMLGSGLWFVVAGVGWLAGRLL